MDEDNKADVPGDETPEKRPDRGIQDYAQP